MTKVVALSWGLILAGELLLGELLSQSGDDVDLDRSGAHRLS